MSAAVRAQKSVQGKTALCVLKARESAGARRARECGSRHESAAVRAQRSVQGKRALCVLKARECRSATSARRNCED